MPVYDLWVWACKIGGDRKHKSNLCMKAIKPTKNIITNHIYTNTHFSISSWARFSFCFISIMLPPYTYLGYVMSVTASNFSFKMRFAARTMLLAVTIYLDEITKKRYVLSLYQKKFYRQLSKLGRVRRYHWIPRCVLKIGWCKWRGERSRQNKKWCVCDLRFV